MVMQVMFVTCFFPLHSIDLSSQVLIKSRLRVETLKLRYKQFRASYDLQQRSTRTTLTTQLFDQEPSFCCISDRTPFYIVGFTVAYHWWLPSSFTTAAALLIADGGARGLVRAVLPPEIGPLKLNYRTWLVCETLTLILTWLSSGQWGV